MNTRKILSVILSLVMILSALPLTAINSFAETSGDFEYEILDDGTAEITAYTGSATELVIPSTLDEYAVTSIGNYAFSGCTSLENVTIPDSVTSIGDYTFGYCESLRSITIPISVKSIGVEAFYDCINLSKTAYKGTINQWVEIEFQMESDANGDSLASNPIAYSKNLYIDDKLVKSAKITSVEKINAFAFFNCGSLEEVTISDDVKSIGEYSFAGTSLKSITIPDSVTELGSYAFYRADIETVKLSSNLEYLPEGLFFECFNLKEVDIPYGVVRIGNTIGVNCNGVFSSCTSLKKVTIPNSVKYIGYYAFTDCTSLENITIPESVESIGIRSFYGCKTLKSITVLSDINLGEPGYYIASLWLGYYYNDEIDDYEKIEGFTIYGYEGSGAESYANENGFTFIALEKEPIVDPVDPNPVDPSTTPNIGDVSGDGKITIADAKWVLQSIAKTRDLDEAQTAAADLNGDGKVTIADAKWILQVVAGTRELSDK